MILFLLRALASLINAALLFGTAPLLIGLSASLRARLMGRPGPSPFQPYRDLRRLAAKSRLTPETASPLYHALPLAACAATGAAGLLLPGFASGALTADMSDLIGFLLLLALARAATMLAGLESGLAFGGAGAARAGVFGIFADAAMLAITLPLALLAHSANIDAMAVYFGSGAVGLSISLGFALAALLAVALTEAGRLPTDNPGGHLELAMVHEAMCLDYAGPDLALFTYTASLRLMIWASLISAIFMPFGMAHAAALASWPLGLILWAVKLLILVVALGLFEVGVAKMRVFRVPEFLGVAVLLGLLSALFLFVAARIGG